MNVGYFKIINEEGRGWWVRADEVGGFGEAKVHPKRPAGRPPQGSAPPKPIPVVTLLLDSGLRLHAREQTLETVINMMTQAGVSPNFVKKPAFHESDRPVDVRDPEDEVVEEDAED
jgi:hypothetical protein